MMVSFAVLRYNMLGILFGLMLGPILSAQTPINQVPFEGQYRDIVIPQNITAKYLVLTAVGGDGGWIERNQYKFGGGEGAFVKTAFAIGKGANQLHPGDTIRFMVGGKGDSQQYTDKSGAPTGVGGGGGTGIAARGLDGKWKILLVAGGGGGAYWSWSGGSAGNPGHAYKNASSAIGDGQAGVRIRPKENEGESCGAGAFGSSYPFPLSLGSIKSNAGWPAGPDYGEPTGGSGSDQGNGSFFSGGWGFGAGGIGQTKYILGGGGGGYSGGAGGQSGKGGSSFVNEQLEHGPILTYAGATIQQPMDGYALYEFTDSNTLYRTVRLEKALHKCLDVYEGKTVSPRNVQLAPCTDSSSQHWLLDGLFVRMAQNPGKCLNLKDSQTENYANIEVDDCHGGTNQQWIFDAQARVFRTAVDPEKCLDADKGLLTDGTNVHLYDCNGSDAQRWLIQ